MYNSTLPNEPAANKDNFKFFRLKAMNKKRKKIIVSFSISLFVLLSIIMLGLGLNYLKKERLLFFATGTHIKAFLNSTWEMSQKEIERKNNDTLRPLSKDLDDILEEVAVSQTPNLLNENRIKVQIGTDKIVYGYKTHVYYAFFDDKLFRLKITGQCYDFENIDSLFISKFKKIYGPVIKDSLNKSSRFLYSFNGDSITGSYWHYNNKENECHFSIELTYTPILQRISNISKQEENSLFK